MSGNSPNLTFIVGEEKRLTEIIGRGEIEPLLRSALTAGLVRAAVLDEDNLPLCSFGNEAPSGAISEARYPLLVEGEPRGLLVVAGELSNPVYGAISAVVHDALQMMVTNNLKRMLTTEVHTSVVQESYEQLVEANRRLTESEARYRNLAMTLEKKVEERSAELQKAYGRMLQQEKLASIGQLAAGMAHEINNPNGFIISNLTTFRKYAGRFKEMLELFRLLVSKDTTIENLRLQAELRWRELKLDYLLDDTELLLAQSLEGAERIKKIVSDLKSFSHVDEAVRCEADLNAELERTLSVLGPQFPADARVIREFSPVPPLRCTPALLCQAFLAIMQNCLLSRTDGLELRIATRCEGETIIITIADNGCGIAPEHLTRVFDPFFTTREVGAGAGMGLSVMREIIASFGGSVEIESEVARGTTVTMRLPIKSDSIRG